MSEEQIQTEKEHGCSCKKLLVLVVLSFLFSILSLGATLYNIISSTSAGNGGPVVISKQYDKGKSMEKALATKKPVVVFFYTDWCGFCQRFVPTYHKFSKDKEIKKNFAIAYVNCEKSENRDLMAKYDVHAFPTVFVVKDENNRFQIENQLLFGENAIEDMKKEAFKAIEESKKD